LQFILCWPALQRIFRNRSEHKRIMCLVREVSEQLPTPHPLGAVRSINTRGIAQRGSGGV
jgi:hypothetical protein